MHAFRACVADLLAKGVLKRIENLPSHALARSGGDRASHSLRVAFLSYAIAGLVGADGCVCARAGLLHDIGYEPGESVLEATIRHSRRSIGIAEELGEGRAVLRAMEGHMFPLEAPPRSLEGLIVWFSDKLDALLELLGLSGPVERVARALAIQNR